MDPTAATRTGKAGLGDAEVVELAFSASAARAAAERDAAAAARRERETNALLHRVAAEWLSTVHREVVDLVTEEHRRRIEEIEAATEVTIRQWKEQERIVLSKASVQAEDQEERLQAALDKRRWLAESVFEAAVPALRKARDEAIAAVDQQLVRIEHVAGEAHRLVRSYRQPARQEPEDAASPTGSAERELQGVEDSLGRLRRCRVAGLFRGPILLVPTLILAAAGAGTGAAIGGAGSALLGAVAGVTASAIGIAALYLVARGEVRGPYEDVLGRLGRARGALGSARAEIEAECRQREESARRTRDSELASAEAKYRPQLQRVNDHLRRVTAEIAKRLPHYQAKTLRQRSENLEAADEWARRHREAADARRDEAQREEDERFAAVVAGIELRERELTAAACDEWRLAQREVESSIAALVARDERAPCPWDAVRGGTWTPPESAPQAVRLGAVRLSVDEIPGAVPDREDLAWPGGRPRWEIPVSLDAPGRMSLVVEAPAARRTEGLRILQAATARILASLPPGKARFTFVDPIGLGQSFAGFMHLADESPLLVTDRIWTDPRHVEQRLADLTEHMETVIQKYLRNEYSSLEEYNRRAGEIAEPYRFLVMADFPASVSEGAAKRFASVLQSGARCGVHVLLLRDPSQPLPQGLAEEDLRRAARTVSWAAAPDGWSVDAGRLAGLRMVPDAAPDDATVLQLAKSVGRAARDSTRVEVPFSLVAPGPGERWSSSSARSLRVPIGRSGATRLQHLVLGEGTSQHALIAGKTGSGKSSLLNALIVNVALWHSPDEVELWLIDFKKGVEFKAYAASGLPHVRAVAVESDREFGLSILQGLDDELRRRGELFRSANVQNLTDWRALGRPERMPRCLLVVDEFQELFIEDDKVAQDAALLLDRLVRQGRAFGMHAILGSQTLGGAYGIARSTMGQMGIRIALQCTEADSQLILSDDNSAARLLSRPGEAIYNDAGGLVEGNNPFQVVWLGDEERMRMLGIAAQAPAGSARPRPIVFEGNQPADPGANGPLERALASAAPTAPLAPRIWLGDAVSIRDPANAALARRPGSNVVIVAQAAEAGAALLAMSAVSVAAQLPAAGTRLVVLDGFAAGERSEPSLASILAQLPLQAEVHGPRDADAAILALGEDVARRTLPGAGTEGGIFLLVNGLHRFRSLRRNENDYSFGDGPPTPDRVLGTILREGPAVGIHSILWADTASNLQRAVDRSTMRDLNFKVLFQMGVGDSSTLIDSPAASRLGMHRAILADEDAGTAEKFRPYGMPDAEYLRRVTAAIRGRAG